jgi:cathepsin E
MTRADVLENYISVIGAILDSSTGFYTITLAQYNSLQPLDFIIGGSTFQLTANAQIWPRSLNSQIGGTDDVIYLAIHTLPNPSGQGLDCVLGFAFLERFYSVFDTTNNRVGFATTQYTTATTN